MPNFDFAEDFKSVLLVIVLLGRGALLFENFEPFFDFLSEFLVSRGVGEVERLLGKQRGLLELACLAIVHCQQVMQRWRGVNTRLKPHSFGVMFEGLVELSLLSQRQGEVIVSFGVVRVKSDRLGEMGQSLF